MRPQTPTDESTPPSQPDVLICLDNVQVALRIGSALSQLGLTVLIKSTVELQELILPNGCQLVVTHTAMIGEVRSRLKAPIVNIETFIFDRADYLTEGHPRRFDGDAFVKRVVSVMNREQGRLATA